MLFEFSSGVGERVKLNFSENQLDTRIYRIVPFVRLLEMFSESKNVLVKPELWEDTFENFILRSKIKAADGRVLRYNFHEQMYGQCWTLENSSDAVWRIYSPDKNGLRIRTTVRKLINAAYKVNPSHVVKQYCIGKVEYLSDEDLLSRANSTFEKNGISGEKLFRDFLSKEGRSGMKMKSDFYIMTLIVTSTNLKPIPM